jgi:two-component system sensor histidine kinase HydH
MNAPAPDHQRLADQYTEIAQLAGGLAHEIKNPLSTIRMNMELLGEDLRESDSPADRRALRKVELVQRECQRLQDLLDNFLSFAKAHRLRREPSELNAVVRRVLDFYRPKAAEAKIEILEFLAGDLPRVSLDAEAFHGALLNLILNAEQAMPGGGQLVVRTYDTPSGVALDLIDTGCGMDEKTLARVFETFYSTKRGGSGLGLPTARKIIEGLGGQIELQSAPGRGTQVTIALPVPARLPAGKDAVLSPTASGPV